MDMTEDAVMGRAMRRQRNPSCSPKVASSDTQMMEMTGLLSARLFGQTCRTPSAQHARMAEQAPLDIRSNKLRRQPRARVKVTTDP
jgi:hypothetical protein